MMRGNSPDRNSSGTATPWSCAPISQHLHVHLVVAENELGRRLHIDKQLLRDWREDFAQLMREQGIAVNATPGAIRLRKYKKTAGGDLQGAAKREVHRDA
jgi:hypothetical protein